MWNSIAIGLVVVGSIALLQALLSNRQLVSLLPEGTVRWPWFAMMGLEGVFVVAYVGYLFLPEEARSGPMGVLVPIIFFLGGLFGWISAGLSFQAAHSVRKVAKLEHEAATDPLTGLYNRRYLDRRLTYEINWGYRTNAPVAVLMIDLDHFKGINDRFGHQVGDMVLVKLAEIIRACVRDSDLVARYGGEEFVVVAPGADFDLAAKLGERIRAGVEEHDFELPTSITDTAPAVVTTSVGIAVLSAEHDKPEALLRAADHNLYQAKLRGRNRVEPQASEEAA
jgi:diguanylate cyclase (GGDEF)-like protein